MADSGTYTPDVYQRRQQLAQKLYMQGQGAQSRNWAEGLGNAAETALGAYQIAKADAQKKVDEYDSKRALAEMLGLPAPPPPDLGQSGASKIAGLLGSDWPSIKSSAPPPVETSSQLLPAPQPNAAPGKIYSNDEPSPLDPPSGQDRTRMIATILGESANQPAVGQNAVASVIRNRAVAGNYGGDTPSGVVTAPNQFEPWNTQGGRNKMAAMAADPKLAAQADQAIAMAYGEGGRAPNDPTGGAKNFIEPRLQTALGRPMPDWAKQPGMMIGDHKFIGGAVPQVAQALAPSQMPQGGMLASATPQQKAAIIAGLSAGEGSPARAIAQSMVSNLTKGDAPTDEIKEYNLAKSQGFNGSFVDFKTAIKKAGATNVNVDAGQKVENKFDEKASTLQAERFDKIVQGGNDAKSMVSDLQSLRDIGSRISTGKTAEAKAALGPYAEALGVKIDGLDDLQAFKAITARLAPQMRVPGSGATSDFEMRTFLEGLPGLGKTPEGNELISKTLEAMAQHKIAAADIASKALNKEITRKDADKMLRELLDPLALWKQSRGEMKPAAPAPKVNLKQKYGLD